jgi:hypothetical protein
VKSTSVVDNNAPIDANFRIRSGKERTLETNVLEKNSEKYDRFSI